MQFYALYKYPRFIHLFTYLHVCLYIKEWINFQQTADNAEPDLGFVSCRIHLQGLADRVYSSWWIIPHTYVASVEAGRQIYRPAGWKLDWRQTYAEFVNFNVTLLTVAVIYRTYIYVRHTCVCSHLAGKQKPDPRTQKYMYVLYTLKKDRYSNYVKLSCRHPFGATKWITGVTYVISQCN